MADISNLEKVTEEILGREDLVSLLDNNEQIRHYIGFEISGLVHLGTGLMSGLVIRELQKLGIDTSIFLADWHTWINNKLSSDHQFIQEVAKEYFAPALKISAQIAGADPSKIREVYGSELYDKNNRYWQTVVEVSKNLTLSRVIKSTTVLGREESDSMPFAYLIYPSMQVADIYEMENKIAHAGMDQRKAHVIAREVAEKLEVHPLRRSDNSKLKPISIHHHLVAGLQKPAQWPLAESDDKASQVAALKMSKSVKGSAVFIHDSEEEIKEKIRGAFCPEKEIGYNPVLDWARYLILPIVGEMQIEREERFGGNFSVKSFEELQERFASGDLFPLDLKDNVARVLIDILRPAREMFSSPDKAEIIAQIKEKTSR